MLILALESSGETASAAVVTEGKVLSEINAANGKTHSETLLPTIDFLLKTTGVTLADVDFVALGAGPGSFTGLRIGAAAAKAICHGAGKRLIPVPSLDALAMNLSGRPGYIAAPVMDARRGQVYACLYDVGGDGITRLTEPSAEDLEEVLARAAGYDKKVIFNGDGSNAFYDRITAYDDGFMVATEHSRLQRAASVGLLALTRTADAVDYLQNPVIYLRKPQAERMYDESHAE